ncbi:hypothetical protein LTR78_000173 [Recurvomyces mirabilis]|uniref:F-box domain-containing protein n=1 Tax=Recurvomyces mirabilis TaxID=574656 RepID=A0AAE0WWR2_9PEZI|nr:hypothetical protein LTR78_000173 [Recurvomyces mirabilis]KAK5161830.1 hypothetical protein LTS14_000175 [Recurvomyces mirabilis]
MAVTMKEAGAGSDTAPDTSLTGSFLMAAAEMTQPEVVSSRLLRLPAALLVRIAGHAEDCSLPSMRLVSRRITETTWKAYLEAFFITRAHLTTTYGLRVLADVSRTEVFARKIKSISLLDKIIYRYTLYLSDDTVRRGYTLQQHDIKQRVWAGSDATTLTQIFSNLARLGLSPRVEIYPWRKRRHKIVHGERQLDRKLGLDQDHIVFCDNQCDRAIAQVLVAMAVSGFKAAALDLCTFHRDAWVGGLAFNLPLDLFEAPNEPFRLLTSLGIGFGEALPTLAPGDLYAASRVFSSPHALEKLSAKGACAVNGSECREMQALMSMIQTTKLKSLGLFNISGTALSFIDGLARSRATLRSLAIALATIPTDNCWTPVLKFLAFVLSIDRVLVSGLYRSDRSRLLKGRTHRQAAAWRDVAGVKDWLIENEETVYDLV